jgi:RNA polymerase sigma-70 factor, ECF subfamily
VTAEAGREALAELVRGEAGLVLASLIATFGDFDLAEDALQDAVATALERWPRDGVPARPAAWLTVAARRRALDRLRHRAMHEGKAAALREGEALRRAETEALEAEGTVPDERLCLLFTCCHPALPPEARVALTLRTLGGLSTEAVARAFLVSAVPLAKRLERAKRKIRDARIPYRVPPEAEWGARLVSVLAVVYLIFNEGYSATDTEPAARRSLCEEAIRLGRVLAALLPREGEVLGLLALMLLHDARRDARVDAGGALVPLDEQDRCRWRRDEIAEGLAALRAAASCPGRGSYQVQAAVVAAHVTGPGGSDTPWWTIANLYAELEALTPSPVVCVNRAVAVARARGPEAGLALLATLEGENGRHLLAGYQPYHAARADLLRRAGRTDEAVRAYRRALELCRGEPERRFLEARLAALSAGARPSD